MAADSDQGALFELPEWEESEDAVLKPLPYPIWTQKKARLVERYLYYFVQITKHGTYIDGFAGPQNLDEPETWTAKLVLESEPRWLRHFYLFDDDDEQIRHLHVLKNAQPAEPKREVIVKKGDFNRVVHKLLDADKIAPREATFCLLDQRTFECHWQTLEALASYKRDHLKIELFYFLPILWLKRAISGLTTHREKLSLWWGRDDYEESAVTKSFDLAMRVVERFRAELGYKFAKAWPIYERQDGGHIMYYMIHATDHSEAPALMHRAYARAVSPKESPEQLMLELGFPPKHVLGE